MLLSIGMIIVVTLNLFWLKKAKNKDWEVESHKHSPSEFTVQLEGLPKGEEELSIKQAVESLDHRQSKSSLVNFALRKINTLNNPDIGIRTARMKSLSFKDEITEERFEVEKVSKAIKIKKLSKMIKKKKSVIKKRIKEVVKLKKLKHPKSDHKIDECIFRIITFSKELLELDRQIEKSKAKIKNDQFTGVAYVTFRTKQSKENFLNKYRTTFFSNFFCNISKFKYRNNSSIIVKPAPEPTDIIWQNLGARPYSMFLKRCGAIVVYSVMVLFTKFVVFILKGYQSRIKENENWKKNIHISTDYFWDHRLIFISLSISAITASVNLGLSSMMPLLVRVESHISKTSMNLSLVGKSIVVRKKNKFRIHLLIIVRFWLSVISFMLTKIIRISYLKILS